MMIVAVNMDGGKFDLEYYFLFDIPTCLVDRQQASVGRDARAHSGIVGMAAQ
jgi:hypothetical protein